jgi:hypothetical protein
MLLNVSATVWVRSSKNVKQFRELVLRNEKNDNSNRSLKTLMSVQGQSVISQINSVIEFRSAAPVSNDRCGKQVLQRRIAV